MFGYITANIDELKLREYRRYHAFYCGVCKSLRKYYGVVSQLTLSYDMSFLAVLLSALYEDETKESLVRCLPHPMAKHEAIINEYTEYAAAMNVLLSYHKCMDDWEDEHKLKKKTLADWLRSAYKKAANKYPKQTEVIEEYIRLQKDAEGRKADSVDAVSGITGDMFGKLFLMKEDVWKEPLYRMGFFMGKFIYIMDAYEDISEDERRKNYNPFLLNGMNTEERNLMVKDLLNVVAAECARAFERLPIIEDAEILRNILYSGIWERYETIVHKAEGDRI